MSADTKRYLAITLSDPRPGKDAEFNEWYDTRHLNDVLSTGVVQSARRYRAVEGKSGIASSHRYVTLYEIETDDLSTAKRLIGGASAHDADTIAELVDTDSVAVWFFELTTERTAGDLPRDD